MSEWTSWFEAVTGAVLLTAGLFKAAYVPGLVVSVLLLALAVIVYRFWRWTRVVSHFISRGFPEFLRAMNSSIPSAT